MRPSHHSELGVESPAISWATKKKSLSELLYAFTLLMADTVGEKTSGSCS
jgi:hypothetical protein